MMLRTVSRTRARPPRSAAVLGLLASLLFGCESAPITGRNQLILVPQSQDAALGLDAWQQIKQQQRVSNDRDLQRRVERIGRRIAAVSGAPAWDWQFTVFADDEPNAFALPGGKVGVNTGLFRVARNDAQLAAVIGHEVAHAIARHGAERMSQGILSQAFALGVGVTTGSGDLAGLAAQAATLAVILPYSRTQESEADEIGLIYMAGAGYDPRAAVELWRNFEALGGSRPPEFLSTHPAEGTRIERLRKLMPQALEVYRANRG